MRKSNMNDYSDPAVPVDRIWEHIQYNSKVVMFLDRFIFNLLQDGGRML